MPYNLILISWLLFTYTFHLSWTGIPEMFIFCIFMCMVLRFRMGGGMHCRNTSSQHSCCMLCVFHCKYCMLHTCISLKMKNIGSHIHTKISFIFTNSWNRWRDFRYIFIMFSKMYSPVIFKKQGKHFYI